MQALPSSLRTRGPHNSQVFVGETIAAPALQLRIEALVVMGPCVRRDALIRTPFLPARPHDALAIHSTSPAASARSAWFGYERLQLQCLRGPAFQFP